MLRTRAVAALGTTLALAPSIALAQGGFLGNVAGGAGSTAGAAGITSLPLPVLVGSIIRQLIGLLGIVLVVLIIYAGFLWMTAQGNDEKIKKAKAIITNAVIGLFITFTAYAIASFVVASLTNAAGDVTADQAMQDSATTDEEFDGMIDDLAE